jgi:hypothetical protein
MSPNYLAYTNALDCVSFALTGPRKGDHHWFFQQIALHGLALQDVAMSYAGTTDIISAHSKATVQRRAEDEASARMFEDVICGSQFEDQPRDQLGDMKEQTVGRTEPAHPPHLPRRRRKRHAPHICTDCGRNFTRLSNLTSHILTHKRDRPRNHICDVCQAGFFRPHELERHAEKHRSDPQHKCVCGKSFFRKDALRRHAVRSCKERSD